MAIAKTSATFNWDVVQTAILTPTGNVTNRKLLTRSDNDQFLSVRAEKYQTLSNQRLLDLAHKVAEIMKLRFSGVSEFSGGKLVFAQIENPDLSQVMGFDMKSNIFIGNGHAGNRQLFLGSSNTYLRCTNQFAHITTNLSFRHTGDLELKLEWLESEVEKFKKLQAKKLKSYEDYSKVKISKELISQCIEQVLGEDKYERILKGEAQGTLLRNYNDLVESIDTEMTDLGRNAWGLFNGVTHFTTHKLEARVWDPNFVSDARAKLNARAMSFVESLKK